MSDSETGIQRIDRLLEEVKKSLRSGMDEKVQEELAETLSLLPYLRTAEYSHLVGQAELIAAALLLDQPDLKLAEIMLERLSHQVRPLRHPLAALLRGGTPPTRVILGLGMLLYFGIPLGIIGLPRFFDRPEIFGIQTEILLMVGFAGALGSIVSIMVRIQDFAGLRDVDSSVLFFTGFFKPVIGASFAMFVFATLRSGLIPVTIQEGSERYFFLALSFVAGFSERFAKDVASTVERQLGTSGAMASPSAPGGAVQQGDAADGAPRRS